MPFDRREYMRNRARKQTEARRSAAILAGESPLEIWVRVRTQVGQREWKTESCWQNFYSWAAAYKALEELVPLFDTHAHEYLDTREAVMATCKKWKVGGKEAAGNLWMLDVFGKYEAEELQKWLDDMDRRLKETK